MKKAYTVITGTVGMDAHVIGTKVLSRALRDAGFNVIELGMQTPPEEFIDVAQETAADAILMSSLYAMSFFISGASWVLLVMISPRMRRHSKKWASTGSIRPKRT